MGSLNDQPAPGATSPVAAHAPAPAVIAPRAWSSPQSWIRLLLVLIIALGADIGSKYWAFHNVAGYPVVLDRKTLLEDLDWNVPHHDGVPALPWGLLDFQLVINRGAVFGIGANQRFFFIAFTLGALSAGLFVFGRYTRSNNWLAHAAIGLILAGGIGNLYDRIVYAVVRDFLHMLPDRELPFGWTWPGGSPELFPWVFNIADTMLLTGMGLLILHMHHHEKRQKVAVESREPGPQPSMDSNQPAVS
jgi:signal peptidase II